MSADVIVFATYARRQGKRTPPLRPRVAVDDESLVALLRASIRLARQRRRPNPERA